MDIVNSLFVDYTSRFSTPESDFLKRLVKKSADELSYIEMISGHQIGQLLQILIRLGSFSQILEIGTFTGYSAISMADALPDEGQVTTIEINEKYRSISAPFFATSPYDKKIRQIMGDACEVISDLKGPFDLIFIDADKILYPEYYRLSKPLLRKGGLIVVDNTLWEGKVISPDDPKTQAVHLLNETIQSDSDMLNVMIPLRDGIMVAQIVS